MHNNTHYICDELHYREVVERMVGVKRELWIGTADIKDVYVKKGRTAVPLLGVLASLLERKGIKIFEAESADKHFSGFSAELGGSPLICVAQWLNDTIYLPRKRMTLAHELGHILFPNLDADEGTEEEYYIMHFAGALLVPRAALFEALGRKQRDSVQLGELLELKHYFGASLKALMIRAWQLGIVSPEAHQRFDAFYASHYYLDKDPAAYAVPEKSDRYRQLVARGVLCGAISREEAQHRFNAPPNETMDINVI